MSARSKAVSLPDLQFLRFDPTADAAGKKKGATMALQRLGLHAEEYGFPDPTERVARIIQVLTEERIGSGAFVDWVVTLHHRLATYTGPSRVYFVSAPAANLIKIGRSIEPAARSARLQLLSPVPLQLLHSVPGGGEIEALLHTGFSSIRSHGEWFHATRPLVGLVAELKASEVRDV